MKTNWISATDRISIGGKNKKIAKKIAVVLILMQGVGLFVPFFAQAASILSPMDATTDLINQLSSTNQEISESDLLLGSRSNKKFPGPTVDVTFSPNRNIAAGQIVTAEARTTGFTKGDESLYFTWYLKHEACEIDADLPPNQMDYCDADGDGEVSLNDWKVEAARIIAKGTYDSSQADYSGSKNESSDGYKAYFGNDIRNGYDRDEAACYMQDFNDGRIYELNTVEAEFVCPSGYHQQCVDDAQVTGCTKEIDNPNYPGVDINGNPEPETITVPDEPSTKDICRATTNNRSLGAEFLPEDEESDNATCKFLSDEDIDLFKVTAVCGENEKPVCIPDDQAQNVLSGANVFGKFFSRDMSQSSLCSGVGVDNPGVTCANLFAEIDQEAADAKTNNITDPNAGVYATCKFERGDNGCNHLFAAMPDQRAGDGEYTMEEEEFWQTNPANPKTANNQNVDEANVVGLGINKFSWEYRPGDKLGVVVEGTFTKETLHNDGSNMVMWALPNQICSALDDIKKENKVGFYTEEQAGSREENILAMDFNINDCLEENLLDPGGSDELTVTLGYTPGENIINDPQGGEFSRGTVLDVQANVSGMNMDPNNTAFSPNSFYYKWKIEVTNGLTPEPPINSDPWIDVTTRYSRINPDLILEGAGLNKVSLPMNLPRSFFNDEEKPYQFIRIKTEASEIRSGGLRGKGTAIIKITHLDKSKDVSVYSVDVDSDSNLSLSNIELCNDAQGKYVCSVTEGEIIGLQAGDPDNQKLGGFQWKMNGQPLTCSASISDDCGGGDVVFFPVTLDEDGDNMFVVTLTAIDSETGNQITIERYFQIVDPSVGIYSMNTETLRPKLFGFYKDINGTPSIPDYSETTFEADPGEPLELGVAFYPSWKRRNAQITWTINGMEMDDFKNEPVVTLDPAEYSEVLIDVNVAYDTGLSDQEARIRKALYTHWGISPAEKLEENSSASIRVEILETDVVAGKKNSGLMANLVSHLPGQVVFLARIMITMFLLLLVSGLVFTFIPSVDTKRI